MGMGYRTFPELEEMIKELNKKNIHLSLWNYPYLQEERNLRNWQNVDFYKKLGILQCLKRLQIQSFCVLALISQIRISGMV